MMRVWNFSTLLPIWAHCLTYLSSCLFVLAELQAAEPLLLAQRNGSTSNVLGDVVDKLGDNLMLIHQDSKKQMWFATWGDGLYRYDGKTVVHFTTQHGLSHNRTDQIVEDSQGNLYFSTSAGVNRFDGNKFSTLTVSHLTEWKLEPGDLWFKGPRFDGSCYRFDGKVLHSLQLPKVRAAEDFVGKNPRTSSPYAVYCIYRDRRENVWFGTAASGVGRYDGKSFEWLTSDDVNEFHNGPSNGVRSMIEDHEGSFWFNTRFRYVVEQRSFAPLRSPLTESIFRRTPGIGSLDGLPDGQYEYLSIAQDHQNTVWIATYLNGVFSYDGRETKHYPLRSGETPVKLFSVYCDRTGAIWLGTHENGAYRFNGTSFEQFMPHGN